jgi:DNA polymerase III delta prime subunit
MREQFLWTEKYRPHAVKDCILPDGLKETFQNFVNSGSVPNLFLVGSSGTGKTTIAKAMLDELRGDYIVVNASLNRNIDTLRNEIATFASSVSFGGGRKYVILDEADYLNAQSFQPALRNFMEEFASNTGFILTGNLRNRIIDAIQSRCSVIEFAIPKSDRIKLATQFLKRVCGILDQEGVKYDKAVVASVVEKYFPDWRRVLNELQRYSHSGTVDTGILSSFSGEALSTLYAAMRSKNFTEVRKWIAENSDNEMEVLFRTFYDNAGDRFKPSYIPQLVLTLAKYQHWGQNCADPEINMAAFLTEVMSDAEWI